MRDFNKRIHFFIPIQIIAISVVVNLPMVLYFLRFSENVFFFKKRYFIHNHKPYLFEMFRKHGENCSFDSQSLISIQKSRVTETMSVRPSLLPISCNLTGRALQTSLVLLTLSVYCILESGCQVEVQREVFIPC